MNVNRNSSPVCVEFTGMFFCPNKYSLPYSNTQHGVRQFLTVFLLISSSWFMPLPQWCVGFTKSTVQQQKKILLVFLLPPSPQSFWTWRQHWQWTGLLHCTFSWFLVRPNYLYHWYNSISKKYTEIQVLFYCYGRSHKQSH